MHYKNEIFSQNSKIDNCNCRRCCCQCCCCQNCCDYPMPAYASFTNDNIEGANLTNADSVPFPTTVVDNTPDITSNPEKTRFTLSGGKNGHVYLIYYSVTGIPSAESDGSEFAIWADDTLVPASTSVINTDTRSGLVLTLANSYILVVPKGENIDVEIRLTGDDFKLSSPANGTAISFVKLA